MPNPSLLSAIWSIKSAWLARLVGWLAEQNINAPNVDVFGYIKHDNINQEKFVLSFS